MIFTLISTPLVINYFKSSGIVDIPGGRRLHKEVTPRMGGLIILSIIFINIFAFYHNLNDLRFFIFGLLLISLCGNIDDIVGLKWNFKIIFHSIAAILIIIPYVSHGFHLEFFGIIFPGIWAYLLLFLFVVGLINSINLMDGLDGLVSGFSLSVFVILLFFSLKINIYFTNILFLTLIGSLLGFLKYNANPAKIFLGDTGSLILGYLIAYSVLFISINLNPSSNYLDLTPAAIMLTVPLLDTLKVIFIRLTHKKNLFAADQSHLHHVILFHKIQQKKVVFIIHIYSLGFILISLIYVYYSKPLAILIWVILSLFLLNINQVINLLSSKTHLRKWLSKLRELVIDLFSTLKKPLLLISLIPAFVIIVSILLKTNKLTMSIGWPFLFISFLLFLTSLMHNKNTGQNHPYYIYLNLLLFFAACFYSNQSLVELFKPGHFLIFISIFLLVSIVLLFSIARKELVTNGESIYSGMDLVMIIITSSVFVVEPFLMMKNLNFLIISLIFAIIFYFWIKILIDIFKSNSDYIYYATFLLPISAFIFSRF